MQNTQKTQTQEEAVMAHFSKEACDVLFSTHPAKFFGADDGNEDLSIFDYEAMSNCNHDNLLEKLEDRLTDGYSNDEIGEFESEQLREIVNEECQTLGFRILQTDLA